MKKAILFFVLAFCAFLPERTSAQCATGYTNCSLNWDYLTFYPSAGITGYTTLAHSQTQRFAFGTQRLTITHNYTGSNVTGTSTNNTAEIGSNGSGADVYFNGNGTITVTFQTGVQNVRFSIYDIEANQRVTVASTGNLVTLSEIGTNAHLSTTGSGTSSATVNSSSSTVGSTNTSGTINVAINSVLPPTTSVTTFTITVSNSGTNSEFYLSDISACSAGTFTNNYYQVAKPFTNQPGYIVTSRNDSFYFVNPANGVAKFLFSDPSGLYANSVAYDPVRHEVYYAFSLTLPGPAIDPNNKVLRRYNYDQDTFGVVIPDISVFAPVFEQGIESGAAAFYDGSLYLGIEASNTGTNSSTVWKIDFNAAGNPTASSQVYASPGAGRDWGDIAVVNGSLVDFDSRPTDPDYFHQDLYTKAVTAYTATAVNAPRQAAVDWNNTIYNIGGSANSFVVGGVTIASGTIATYNGDGTINTTTIDTIKYNGVTEMGSWGDAGEAFKPRVDYGDAPATFDPAASDPAVHEISNNLYLGSNRNDEWNSRGQTALANSDNFDDCMAIGSLVNPSTGTFLAQVRYFNNTGAPATICAWVDFNSNGVFNPGEGRIVTNLPSSPLQQTIWVNWTGVSTTLVDGSFTYLRIRITSAANAMTVNNPTGYYDNGEVEDYRLMVTRFPLTTQLVTFNANRNPAGKVLVNWQLANEAAGTAYTVQRSTDGFTWTNLKTTTAVADRATAAYTCADETPLTKTTHYRLRLTHNGAESYSQVKKIETAGAKGLSLAPNPATTLVDVRWQAEANGPVQFTVTDAAGRVRLTQTTTAKTGENSLALDVTGLPAGVYWVQIITAETQKNQRLLIRK